MRKYANAILRTPCQRFVEALSSVNLGRPDYHQALKQHAYYIEVLKECGLEVLVLPANNYFPDSTFIEDTAVLIPNCAIITNPGAPSRKKEVDEIAECLKSYFENIDFIYDPGTLDGGDVLIIGSHCYIGISRRTNLAGANQLTDILKRYEMSTSLIEVKHVLHLKSSIACVGEHRLVIAGELIDHPAFRNYELIKVDPRESYSANCLHINNKVLVAKGYPGISQAIADAGFTIVELEMSEFRKADGGLSCLSLRF
jgi:dimethylargininase